jgi:hypothetical protein
MFVFIGTFTPVVHVVLFVPGIVRHQKVFLYTQPYFLKLTKAINCPYCNQE